MGWIVRLDEKGRIVIPREIRNRLLLKEGDILTIDMQGNIVTLSQHQVPEQAYETGEGLKHFLSQKT